MIMLSLMVAVVMLPLVGLAIDGSDLIRLGIAPGREIGEILKRLLAAVIADPSLNTRDALLALAAERSSRDPTRPD